MTVQNKEPALHNEPLEAAIKNFKTDQSNENMVKILSSLAQATVMQPVFLPADADKAALRKLIEKSQSEKTPVQPGAGTRPLPVVLKNEKGEQFFAIFTGKSQIPEKQKYPGIMYIPFRECARLAVKENLQLAGVVLNPFTDNLVLHKAALDMINQNVAKQTANVELSLGDAIAQMELPRNFHQDRRKFMEEIAGKKEEFVAECYRAGCRKFKGENAACPYQKTDFDVMILNVSDTLHMARIGFTEGGAVKGLCISALCFHNPQTDEGIYYFLKKGGKGSPNLLFSVDEKNVCTGLGEAPPEGRELYELINRVPWEKKDA